MLLLATSLKLITEIALMALLGRGLVGLLAGHKRDGNIFYQLLKIISEPFVRVARWLAPRVVIDRHVPLVAFFLLGMGWVVATLFKIQLCVEAGVQACR
jgi:hypothetical protein